MRRLGKTPPFRGPRGEVVPGSVAEVTYRQFGGLDQWVMVRGESVANPPLILLHGGPGFSETGFFRRFNARLEKLFTAVYWDQRGAGKSFDRSIARSSMTVEQFIGDLDELVDAVCKRLGKSKVAIFGHSWGSVLGVLYAARFPEKVAAYVGSGQIGDWAAAESGSYEWARAEAQRPGTAGRSASCGRSGRRRTRQRPCSRSAHGCRASRANAPPGPVEAGTSCAGRAGVLDLRAAQRVARLPVVMNAMWAEVSRLNLIELAPALQMPVFFFLGRKDHFVPPRPAWRISMH